MAPMKRGTYLGKNDSRYNGFKIGDHLRNIHSGITGTVNKYGGLDIPGHDGIPGKDLNGEDWVILTQEEIQDILEGKGAPADEGGAAILDDNASIIVDEVAEEFINLTKKYEALKVEYQHLQDAYDNLTIADFSASSMVLELRNRGYEVSCKRTIVEEL